MNLLTNPLVLRMVFVLFTASFAFLVGMMAIRRMRRNFAQEAEFHADPPSPESFPLHTYHAVIQQLKQQKHELQSSQASERRRARTSENISAAILSNLSSGVVFFTPNGLVRQANTAAKRILGFASPAGMSAAEVFRQTIWRSGGAQPSVAQAVDASLRELKPFPRGEAEYLTPSGEQRVIDIALTAVHSPTGEILGAACLINDQSEIAQIRRQQELRGEMSAEMALALRNSLTTISGYGQQLAASRDPELARQLAADIAAEAAHLDRTIGGFLAGARAAAAASGD